MSRSVIGVSIVGSFLLIMACLGVVRLLAHDDDDGDSRVRIGLRIAPVHLNLKGKDRELVGVGSYLVNAVGGCNDCHTCPSYEPGHNPYGPPFGPVGGGDGKINSTNYLAGGVLFAPPGVTSANITPDATTGKPEGHTFHEFRSLEDRPRSGRGRADSSGDAVARVQEHERPRPSSDLRVPACDSARGTGAVLRAGSADG